MYQAPQNGHRDVVEVLMDVGADPNKATNGSEYFRRRWTPLLVATWNGHKDVVQLLLNGGADMNYASPSPCRTTPSWVATYRGHTDIVRMLIDHQTSEVGGFMEEYKGIFKFILCSCVGLLVAWPVVEIIKIHYYSYRN